VLQGLYWLSACQGANEIIEEFHDAVWKWAEKYNVELERLDKKPIYYILGVSN